MKYDEQILLKGAAALITPQENWLYAMITLFVVLALLALYRRRELLRLKLRQGFIMCSCAVLAFYAAKQFTADNVRAGLFALLVELIVGFWTRPRRSRYIPRSERRKVIARFERSGRRYDSRRHHIDHIIPYAKGGSNRADNLRVLDGEKNLAKSDRSPWWDVFSR